MVKPLKNILLLNQPADGLETRYVALGTQILLMMTLSQLRSSLRQSTTEREN